MHCVDLGESFPTNLLPKIGVDTAENEPLEVWGKIQFIIHLPPYLRPEELRLQAEAAVDVEGRDAGPAAPARTLQLLASAGMPGRFANFPDKKSAYLRDLEKMYAVK